MCLNEGGGGGQKRYDMGIHQQQVCSVPLAVTEISAELVHINYLW